MQRAPISSRLRIIHYVMGYTFTRSEITSVSVSSFLLPRPRTDLKFVTLSGKQVIRTFKRTNPGGAVGTRNVQAARPLVLMRVASADAVVPFHSVPVDKVPKQ